MICLHSTCYEVFVTIVTGGHSGRVVTLSPPTSEAGVRFPAWPQVGKLVVACRWSAVYSTEPCWTVCTGFLYPSNYPSWYDLYSVESDVKPEINKKKCNYSYDFNCWPLMTMWHFGENSVTHNQVIPAEQCGLHKMKLNCRLKKN